MEVIKDGRGQVLGYKQKIGEDNVQFLDKGGKVIAREINGRTYNDRGEFKGLGNLGMIELGKKLL